MQKIKYKNLELSRTKVRNNILRVWEQCSLSEKHDWYGEANRFARRISEIYFIDNSRVIGIISALSPMKPWKQNKKMVEEFILYGTTGTFKSNVDKCERIMRCDGTDESILSILNGEKTKNFYLNIKYPNSSEHLTVDRHAIRIAFGIKDKAENLPITPKQYEFIKNAYISAAHMVGVKPLLMQSATWVRIRTELQ